MNGKVKIRVCARNQWHLLLLWQKLPFLDRSLAIISFLLIIFVFWMPVVIQRYEKVPVLSHLEKSTGVISVKKGDKSSFVTSLKVGNERLYFNCALAGESTTCIDGQKSFLDKLQNRPAIVWWYWRRGPFLIKHRYPIRIDVDGITVMVGNTSGAHGLSSCILFTLAWLLVVISRIKLYLTKVNSL